MPTRTSYSSDVTRKRALVFRRKVNTRSNSRRAKPSKLMHKAKCPRGYKRK